MEIIRSLTGEEVLLVLEEPRELTIRAGKSRFKIHGCRRRLPDPARRRGRAPGRHPLRRLPPHGRQDPLRRLGRGSRFQLNGALLKLKDSSLEMVATDGHRLALVEGGLESAGGEDAVLVPRKALQELQRLEGDGKLEYHRGEHHLSFLLGRRELICRILEGTFPDYERVIAKDNDKKAFFDRKPLAEAVQRVALLTGDRARAVRLQFAPDQMVISAANPDLGEATEEVPCDYDGRSSGWGSTRTT